MGSLQQHSPLVCDSTMRPYPSRQGAHAQAMCARHCASSTGSTPLCISATTIRSQPCSMQRWVHTREGREHAGVTSLIFTQSGCALGASRCAFSSPAGVRHITLLPLAVALSVNHINALQAAVYVCGHLTADLHRHCPTFSHHTSALTLPTCAVLVAYLAVHEGKGEVHDVYSQLLRQTSGILSQGVGCREITPRMRSEKKLGDSL